MGVQDKINTVFKGVNVALRVVSSKWYSMPVRVVLILAIMVGIGVTSWRDTEKVEAATPPDSCFAFSANTITAYYEYENDDSLNPVCPTAVDIPATIGGEVVLTIGSTAFAGKSLTTVTFPDGVERIESAAFAANQLTSVVLPDSVTFLGSSAFTSNSSLTTVILSNNLETIESNAFSSSAIEDFSLPDSIVTIGSNILSGNPVQSVSIGTAGYVGPATIVVGEDSFQNIGLDELYLGPAVLEIGEDAFSQNNLTELNLPNGITKIGNFAFNNNDIASLVLPDSVIELGNFAFLDNDIATLDLGQVQVIGTGAFNQNSLVDLFIPNTVTVLEDISFQSNPLKTIQIGTLNYTGSAVLDLSGEFNISTAEEVIFGNIVRNIGLSWGNVLSGNQLKKVYVGANVEYIGANALAGNAPLEEVYIYGNPELDANVFNGSGTGHFIRIYATDPDFITEHAPGLVDVFEGDIVGGYIINPAEYTIEYKTTNGTDLQAPFMSGVGEGVIDYSFAANPTGDLSLYYQAGDMVSVEGPAFDGFITPTSRTESLQRGANTFTVLYASVTVPSEDSEDPQVGAPNTGVNAQTSGLIASQAIGAASALLVAGVVMLLRRKKA